MEGDRTRLGFESIGPLACHIVDAHREAPLLVAQVEPAVGVLQRELLRARAPEALVAPSLDHHHRRLLRARRRRRSVTQAGLRVRGQSGREAQPDVPESELVCVNGHDPSREQPHVRLAAIEIEAMDEVAGPLVVFALVPASGPDHGPDRPRGLHFGRVLLVGARSREASAIRGNEVGPGPLARLDELFVRPIASVAIRIEPRGLNDAAALPGNGELQSSGVYDDGVLILGHPKRIRHGRACRLTPIFQRVGGRGPGRETGHKVEVYPTDGAAFGPRRRNLRLEGHFTAGAIDQANGIDVPLGILGEGYSHGDGPGP